MSSSSLLRHKILSALIIKKIPLGEADNLLTFFSLEEGKIQALAKGSRKVLSRVGGHCVLGKFVRVEMHQGEKWNRITGLQGLPEQPALPQDLNDIKILYQVLELTACFSSFGLSQPDVFELLLNSLNLLPQTTKKELILSAFIFKILTLNGLIPSCAHCLECSQKFTANSEIFWQELEGGFGCKNCLNQNFEFPQIEFKHLKLANFLQKGALPDINKLQLTADDQNFLNFITNKLLNLHSPFPLRTQQIEQLSELD